MFNFRNEHHTLAILLNCVFKSSSFHGFVVLVDWVVGQPCSTLVLLSEQAKTAAAAILKNDDRENATGR